MATRPDNTWFDLARPVLNRLDGDWRDEAETIRGIAFPGVRVCGAERLGFVERRRHWLTRRTQIRLTPAALGSARVNAERGQGAAR
ncbi:hypothetical protein FHS95_000123 [Sphingomonas naasensis]|uniref:hypothetical protein n=1 Tax=Sphingomonas naasensis TaxID=1344951 RepID=UPI00141A6D19|nr:hypothetical protein [Sphingomonas naasensis]NIJ18454.1 hypothetical protein [Sphingomonas naasensis]